MQLIKHNIIWILLCIFSFSSCENFLTEGDPINSPKENFYYLWDQADQKYSFFEYKNIDWDSIYQVYDLLIDSTISIVDTVLPGIDTSKIITDEELFDIMAKMLNVLEDGHVNLFSPFNISRYWAVFLNSPPNFNFNVLERNYLGDDYMITGPFMHQIFNKNSKQIGYVYYSSFSYTIGDEDMDYILSRFKNMDGLIIDVRDNGGGDPANVFNFARRFTDKNVHVYTSLLKNGPEHDDFSTGTKVYLEPEGDISFTKPIMLLTNRGCYSATNLFAAIMTSLPNCTQIGDTSGGGGGVPVGGELPNGWTYRFSATQTINPDGFNIEAGIPPDIPIWNSAADEALGIDSIMERAFMEF